MDASKLQITRCLRCNRLLKNPASVKNGQGPTCYRKSEAEQRLARLKQRDIEEVLGNEGK
jgi:hypothetical protein